MKHDIDTMTMLIKDAATFERYRLGEPRPIKPEDFEEWLNAVIKGSFEAGYYQATAW